MTRAYALGLTLGLIASAAAAAHTHQAHPLRAPIATARTAALAQARPAAGPIAILIDPAHELARFTPEIAFGAGVDGVPAPAVPKIYTPANVAKMLAAGFGPVSYRLYTELSVQDWHWSPAGTFSDGAQGYWTSGAPATKTVDTYGYRLPRRGNTGDQGNNDDYSRLDDGSAATFWKSNPYLTHTYTHEDDALHLQWVLVDLGKPTAIDTARIAWGTPWATNFVVQYWTGPDPFYGADTGEWVNFPAGPQTGTGGTATVALGQPGHMVRFVRVLLTRASGTCPAASTDPRDCMGYAIAELGLGTTTSGVFDDAIVHRADNRQTATYASSTDPWHRAADRVTDQEQPGLDIVLDSGLTRALPVTVPVPMLYSTPENAAAEIRYLKARGTNIARVELGEEPDGQFIVPEDYAALYIQWADAIHAVDPALVLGGPVYEGTLGDVFAWPNAAGERSFTRRFLASLAAHGHSADLGFFSFEHYPFDACSRSQVQADLLAAPGLIADVTRGWRALGVPATTPIYVTEANYSAGGNDFAQRVEGAVWLADFYGSLLSAGGAGAFFYEYEPIPLSPSACHGYGAYGPLLGNANYVAGKPLSQYFAVQLLTHHWTQRGAGEHRLFGATATPWVGAYPVQRPDGSWAVLLINRDLKVAHDVTLGFGARAFAGSVRGTVFGAAQYLWVEAGANGHPSPDGPAATFVTTGGAGKIYTLPKASATVLEGALAP